MALFTITTKRKKICNGVQIEPGMTVQLVSPFANPVTVNGGQAVEIVPSVRKPCVNRRMSPIYGGLANQKAFLAKVVNTVCGLLFNIDGEYFNYDWPFDANNLA